MTNLTNLIVANLIKHLIKSSNKSVKYRKSIESMTNNRRITVI